MFTNFDENVNDSVVLETAIAMQNGHNLKTVQASYKLFKVLMHVKMAKKL